MNSNSIFTRRHAGADAAASVSAPATLRCRRGRLQERFHRHPRGVRGKDVTKAAKALLKDSVKRGGGSIQMRDVVKIYPAPPFTRSTTSTWTSSPAKWSCCSAAPAAASPPRCARSPASKTSRAAASWSRPRRHRRAGQQARDGHGVPGLLAFPAHDRPGERGIRPRSARHGQGRTPQDRHGTAGARGTCRSGQEVHAADVRRPATARGPGPRAGRQAARATARRAALRPRRQGARPAARPDSPHPTHHRHHHRLR
mgnify:CR=1 FL=1